MGDHSESDIISIRGRGAPNRGRLRVSGKKRWMPIVALGALLISLFAILPATGAGEVSFIDPAI